MISLSINRTTLLTVVISTKDRCIDLVNALTSIYQQSIIPAVIVISDGCIDDTNEMVAKKFPEVQLIVHKISKGYIARRNEAVYHANTDYVLSIDDDCILSSINTISSIIKFCELNLPKAVAWPHEDVITNNGVLHNIAKFNQEQVFSFKGCSFVVERKTFLELNGFRSVFIHQGEEEDFCLRLLNSGFYTIKGNEPAIKHFESPRRNFDRMDYFGSRNLILFSLLNIPFPYLLVYLVGNTLNILKFCLINSRYKYKLKGMLFGYIDGVKLLPKHRNPVNYISVRQFRRLKK